MNSVWCLSQVYLSLPAGVSMAEGHCLICPLQHYCCATALDEDVWSEIQVFKAQNPDLQLKRIFLEMFPPMCKSQILNLFWPL